jgi:hypothetical protein
MKVNSLERLSLEKRASPGHSAHKGSCFLRVHFSMLSQALRGHGSHGPKVSCCCLSWWQTLHCAHDAGFAGTQNASYGVMEASTQISKEGLGGQTKCGRVAVPAVSP